MVKYRSNAVESARGRTASAPVRAAARRFGATASQILVKCWPKTGRIAVKYRPDTGQSRPNLGRMVRAGGRAHHVVPAHGVGPGAGAGRAVVDQAGHGAPAVPRDLVLRGPEKGSIILV
jgi:hypothetical protein